MAYVYRNLIEEFQVNTARGSEMSSPRIAALGSGGFVTTWAVTSGAGGGSGSDVRAQLYNAAGVAVGGEYIVNTVKTGTQDQVEVIGLDGGGFAMVWRDMSGDTYGNVKARIFGANGTPIGNEFRVNSATASAQIDPAISELPGGGFVAVWADFSQTGGDADGYAVKAQIFGAAGERIGGEFLVNTTTVSAQWKPAVTTLESGGFVVTWEDYSKVGGDTVYNGIKAQMFDGSGKPVGAEFLVNTTTFDTQSEPSITALASGGFAIAWSDDSANDQGWIDTEIRVQIFNAQGVRVGTEILASGGQEYGQFSPTIDSLPDGGFIVSWRTSGSIDLEAQIFDARGRLVGDRMALRDEFTSGSALYPSLAVLASGDLANIWLNSSWQDGQQSLSIQGRIIPRLEIVTGTDRADTLTGTSDHEWFEGVAGDDTLNGGGGNDALNGGLDADRLNGGSGNDRLIGGSGDDVLSGGIGGDAMDGGTGHDTYYVDDIDDSIWETSGNGIDTVISSLSVDLLNGSFRDASIEKIILTGAAISAKGNSVGNQITGNAADNILSGGGGNDTLIGKAGDDLYYGYGKATIIEAAGGGHDRVLASTDWILAAEVEDLVLTGEVESGTGNASANLIVGNDAANYLNGKGGADTLRGGSGSDVYVVDAGDTLVERAGGGYADEVRSSISFTLDIHFELLTLAGTANINGTGNYRDNRMDGNAGANMLDGAGGGDVLVGWSGNDRIFGGTGNDGLYGGAGADSYYFDTALNPNSNVDRLGLDLADTIYLDRSIFGGVAEGRLKVDAFHLGTQAADAEDRILYDSTSGNIWYDADGIGGAAAILFATVVSDTQRPEMTNLDFVAYTGG